MDLFWDFDGTLFDTYPNMVTSFRQALKEVGHADVTEKTVYQVMRQASLGAAFKKFVPGGDDFKLRQAYRHYEKQRLASTQPFAGTLAICQTNVNRHGRNFLLTHRNAQARKLLDEHGFTPLFTGYVTSDNHFPRKPDPASLNYLIDQFRVNKKAAFMIGDRNLDILAAHRAGIKGVLFDPDATIQVTSSPDLQVTNFHDLYKLLWH
ncbi:HAD-IA family hydrolase [Pediococcus siamensis]|uniref:HAD-IA family hydrolase n=1 Tax=Pediococcus siamensis TaxID=381829 RepID=UPI00399F48A4